MKIILLVILLILSNLLEAQDIVYDSLRGSPTNWRRIKWGTTETVHSTWFENQGIIVRSKVLLSARVFTNLVRDVDYTIKYFPFPSNILWTEIKTTDPTNLIIYKYYGPVDTVFYVGLRKAKLGSDLFTGQYFVINPVMPKQNCIIRIYNGIGSSRQLYLTIDGNNITDADIGDYMMSNQVTIEAVNGTNVRLFAKIMRFIDVDTAKYAIKAWPIPVSDNLHLEIIPNDGLMVRIFDSKPSLVYEQFILDEESIINVSSFKSGLYLLVVSDEEMGNIIKVIKIIIIPN